MDIVKGWPKYWPRFANASWVDLFETTMELARFRCQGNGGKADDGIQEMEEELPEPLVSTLKLSPLLCFPPSICDSFLFHLHPKNSHPLHLFITPTLSLFLMDYSGGGPAPAPATGRARVRGRWCYCRCFRRSYTWIQDVLHPAMTSHEQSTKLANIMAHAGLSAGCMDQGKRETKCVGALDACLPACFACCIPPHLTFPSLVDCGVCTPCLV
uniref:Uncharacterized protein n=1 Tax=Oryza glumipatula TaxID=40148 RepID=A0A0D9YTI9_9ORYZ